MNVASGGKYFPGFCKRETRLFDLDEFEEVIDRIPGLEIESTEFFEYSGISMIDRLSEQVRQCHYSTFCLYSKTELETALSRFMALLKAGTTGTNEINLYCCDFCADCGNTRHF